MLTGLSCLNHVTILNSLVKEVKSLAKSLCTWKEDLNTPNQINGISQVHKRTMELFLVTLARTLQTSIYQNTKQLGKMSLELWITMVLLAYRTAKVVQAWTQTSTAQSAFKTNQLASFQVSNRFKIKVLAMLLHLVTRKYKVYLMESNKTNESCI